MADLVLVRPVKDFVLAVLIAALVIGAGFVGRPSLYQMFTGFAYLRRVHVETEKKIAALPPQRIDQLAQQAQQLAATRASENVLLGSDIPSEFDDLRARSVFIKPDAVFIEFMGGLDHIGLVMRKSDHYWSVYRYDEAHHEILVR